MRKKGIVWLRNNLRLEDNPSICRSLEDCDEILCTYVFDERIWSPPSSQERMGNARAKFMLESIAELKEEIESRGGMIEFLYGNPVRELPKLMAKYGADTCYAQKEDAWEETEQERALAREYHLILSEGKGLWEDAELPFALEELPGVFSSFRRKVEKSFHVRSSTSAPKTIPCDWKSSSAIPTLSSFGFDEVVYDSRSVLEFRGGCKQGMAWMDEWIWQRDCLKQYKETRNGMVGADYSSKLSTWLANGCVSPIQVYEEIKKYEDERVANESTYWLFFELLWREFFRFVARRFGPQIFLRAGIKDSQNPATRGDRKTLNRWKEGRTADSFVNANMIELATTGWMSNRGRQNVASYLIHDLGQDWLAGAKHFEKNLIDYDPCSNYGNWLYLAGVGNDPRPNRAFNVSKQAEYYDPDLTFRDLWARD
jgi:deoxyribodipyrimidine photo-lyase